MSTLLTRLTAITASLSLATGTAAVAAEPTYEEAAGFFHANRPSVSYEFPESEGFSHIIHTLAYAVRDDAKLSKTNWTWAETERHYARNKTNPEIGRFFRSRNEITYSVNPAALSATVEIGRRKNTGDSEIWDVTVKCSTEPCITKTGSLIEEDADDKTAGDQARRVAKALSHMIKLSGGKESAF